VTVTINVVQFQRRAPGGGFSVERLFEDVRRALPADIAVAVRTNRHPSRGVVKRLSDALSARLHRGDINHVLGDVHYLAWFLPRQGTILTVLDCGSLERLTGARRHILWFFWYWWPLRRATRVTVISEYTRRSLLEWVRYPADDVHVIPPPLSAEFVAAPAPPRGERLRLLHIGTTPNKNLARVIEAAQGLPLTLVIIGHMSVTERALLTRLNIAFENHFDLERAQLVDQYRHADALIFASTYEGFGLPIVEAQAIGRPVITSNICSMPEAAGGAALLVDPFDVNDIRRAIRSLIEDPTGGRELVKRGHHNAMRYAPERIAAQYAALYRTIHAGRRSGP
jgi:glycosyltransferase involved in cell wall biosynthesis